MPLIFIIFFFEKRSLLLPLITRHIRTAIDYPKQTALVYRRSYSSRYISFVPPKKVLTRGEEGLWKNHRECLIHQTAIS